MDNLKSILSHQSPLEDVNVNVFTSTPTMKSEIGRRLIKRQFVINIPLDISSMEVQFKNVKIENHSLEEKPFIFTKEPELNSPTVKFHSPNSISIETIAKYQKMFSETPKLKKMCLRL